MSAPQVVGPEQLPDLRLWLADQWQPGRPYATAAAAMHAARSIVTASPEQYRRAELAMLQHATLWWVAEPMVDLLLASALGLATATGGVQHGELHPIKTRPDLAVPAAKMATDADPGMIGSIGSQRMTQWAMTGETWVPLGRSDWPVGDPVEAAPWANMPDGTVASMVEDRKVLAAFWTLIHQQGIASRTVREPQRQAARRTERAGVARELAKVQVITLRKLDRTDSPPGDEHAAREWSHRWLVSGHWRWQPHGPGRTLRRLTYVRPHVKGPADKPLHVPERVNAWVR